jgi:hypothetical protein
MSAIQQIEIDGIPHPEPKNTAIELIEATIAKGVTPADLATLLDVKLRFEAAENKRRFDEALERFRANPPEIERTKHVEIATRSGDAMSYDHAELDKANKIVTEALRAVGITHHWKAGEINGRTAVTLMLRGFGHTEEMGTLSGPPDTSGGKNSIQAIGSTTSYLQRYVLLASLGLVAEGQDDDGKTEGLPEDTIRDYCVALNDESDMEQLKATFKECYRKAKDTKDKNAEDRFIKVYEEGKKRILAARSRQ